jgi:hypothetical protein
MNTCTADRLAPGTPLARNARAGSSPLIHNLTADAFMRLLQSHGYDIHGDQAGDRRACWAGAGPRFRAEALRATGPGADTFAAFQLSYSERLSPAGVALAEQAASERVFESQVIAVGDQIQLRQQLSLAGGVSEAELRSRFESWDAELREFRAAIAEACGLVDPQSLN